MTPRARADAPDVVILSAEEGNAAARVPKRPSRMRRIACGGVLAVGLILIGAAAIPAGLLLCVIFLTVRAMSALTDRIETGGMGEGKRSFLLKRKE